MFEPGAWLAGLLILNWLFTAGLVVLVLGAYHEIRRLDQSIAGLKPSQPKASRLRANDPFPALGIRLAERSILLFLAYGCSGCAEISRRLDGVDFEEWKLYVLVRGVPSREPLPVPAGHPLRTDGTFELPRGAEIMHDPEGKWFRELDIRVTPTAIAVKADRVVTQEVAPNVDWFTALRRPGVTNRIQTVVIGGEG